MRTAVALRRDSIDPFTRSNAISSIFVIDSRPRQKEKSVKMREKIGDREF